MAARLATTAGAAALGGVAALKYQDDMKLAQLLHWALGAASAPATGAVTPASVAVPAPVASAPVIPQINITTSSADGGASFISWRLAAAIGSGALAGVYYAYKSGVTLQDLTWVTQSVFDGAVDELQSAVASTQSAIEKCHEEVGMQIDELEQQVNDTRDHLEHTVKTEVGYNREAIQEVQQQLQETDATICEMRRQVATRKQLEELRALVDKMKSTGDSTYEELKQLHAEIRALAAVLIQQHADGLHMCGSGVSGGQRSLTMGRLGNKLSEALALAERQAGLAAAVVGPPLGLPAAARGSTAAAAAAEPHPEEEAAAFEDRPFTPPTEPLARVSASISRPPFRNGLLRTNRNF